MLYKYYEIRCDYCKRIIIYTRSEPNDELLRKIGVLQTRSPRPKHFCSEWCYDNWKKCQLEK